MEEKFAKLEETLNVYFKNKDLLIQAFCHRSFLNENASFPLGHNERLEFLGDAVLELAVTEYLYLHYPQKSEGELTAWRASLVNTKVIGEIARSLRFYDYLLLSKGEKKEGGRAELCILANTFESFIGALYLDRGYKETALFIKENLVKELPRIIKLELYRDPKSNFQEKTQEELGITPTYNLLEETGPDHKRYFSVGVYLEEKLIAEGGGWSKKEAEEEAAKKALKEKKWLKLKE